MTGPSSSTTSTVTGGNSYIYWPFSVISVFCFCFGVPSNFFSLIYFAEKNRHRPNYASVLYIIMNAVDLVICFLCLPKAMTNLSGGRELFFSVDFLCSAWGYLWQILIRLSVFSVGLMSIYRTISLSLPFVKLSKRHILIPGTGYLVIQILQQSMPWWYGQSYNYNSYFGICMWSLWFDRESIEFKVMLVLMIILPFILPLFPIVISCLISILKLKKNGANCDSGSTKVGNKHAAQAKEAKRAATITIVLLTITYIVFNVPYCLLMIDQLVPNLTDGKTESILAGLAAYPHYIEIYNFIVFYSIPLNSTINPIIYITRMKNLRHFILNVVSCKKGRLMTAQMVSAPTATTYSRSPMMKLHAESTKVCSLHSKTTKVCLLTSPKMKDSRDQYKLKIESSFETCSPHH